MGQALVRDPELLLLDEPTNHLDIASIEWLESYLLSFAGTLVFVTHDRVFLDRLATGIVELDRGRLRRFPANWAAYREHKNALSAVEETEAAQFDRRLAQEEAWIRQGWCARGAPATKAGCGASWPCVTNDGRDGRWPGRSTSP